MKTCEINKYFLINRCIVSWLKANKLQILGVIVFYDCKIIRMYVGALFLHGPLPTQT